MKAACAAWPLRIATGLAAALWVARAVAAAELPESPWVLAGSDRPPRSFADVRPICVPDSQRPEIALAAQLAGEGGPYDALRSLPALGTALDPEAESSVALVRAVLEARTLQPGGYEGARAEIARRVQRHEDPAARICGRLERARLALRAGFAEEAFGDLAVAQRELPKREKALARSIEFYRAETEWMSGDDSSALARYRGLASSSGEDAGEDAKGEASEAIAWVARTRIAAAEPDLTWLDLRARLELGRELGIDVDGWSVHAGELALRDGEVGDAIHWLSRAEQLSPQDELAEIRKSDGLLLRGERDLAVRILERVERGAKHRVSQEIAAIRLARQGVGAESRREERLQGATRSSTPRVAARALQALLQHHLAAGRSELALDVVVRLRNLAPRGGIPGIDAATDAVVRLAADTSEDCVTLVRRLAGGREVWLRSLVEAEPILRLGDCALELGLTSTAIDVYRALGRRFPDDLGPDLTLRIAEASLALGEHSVVASILAADERSGRSAELPFRQRAAWLRLRAQIAVGEGSPEEALDLYQRLAASSETPPHERENAARALAAFPSADARREALAAALETALEWDEELSEPLEGAVWLRLADIRNAQGRPARARIAYQQAARRLPPGPARGRTLHALAASTSARAERERLLDQLAADESSGHWAKLAGGELRLSRLQDLIARSRRFTR